MINYKIICTAFLLFTVLFASAQMDKKTQKQLKKVEKMYKKKSYTKASVQMKEVLNKYPANDKLWKMYQTIMYQNYVANDKSNLSFTIKVKDSDGLAGSDSLTESLQKSMEYVLAKPKYEYYNSLCYTALSIPYETNTTSLLRRIYVDKLYTKDDEVTKLSKVYFEQGEGEFTAKNYQKAIEYYQKAYEEDTSNFKALLYIGDSYFAMQYYGESAAFFRRAMARKPLLNEPVKYLTDALSKKGEVEQALENAKFSLLVYPEEATFIQIYNCLKDIGGLKLERNWVLRLAAVANVTDAEHRNQFYSDPLHFQHYINALVAVRTDYDEHGLLKIESKKPLDKYLEVHCWKKMLEATQGEDIPALEYARYMDSEGLLAPYLFVSLFNVDMYPQYRHLVDNNPELIKRYIGNYLIVSKDKE
jgi:tetratricopeptide (TPR) repeat protein